MTRPSPFSVRGRRALMVMRDEREISIAAPPAWPARHDGIEHDPAEPPPNEAADVILMDADAIPIKSDQATAWKVNVPIIALIGTETPEPAEMAARSAAGVFPRQAAAFGRDFTPRWWLRSIPRNEESMKPPISKSWRIASGPGGSCSPPFCRSCAVTLCRRQTRFRSSDRPRCGIARRSSNCARKSSRPVACRTGRTRTAYVISAQIAEPAARRPRPSPPRRRRANPPDRWPCSRPRRPRCRSRAGARPAAE